MPEEISVENLPSREFYEEVQECMNHEDISISINNLQPSIAGEWVNNFRNYSKKYLDKYITEGSSVNGSKRCRDYVYLLVDVKKMIKDSKDPQSYTLVEQTIDSFNTTLEPYGYDNCSMFQPSEYSDLENIKKLDDFCQDITYITSKIEEINRSLECNAINSHFKSTNMELNEIYQSNTPKYEEILKYYKINGKEDIDRMINQISCSTSINNQEREPQMSSAHTSVLASFSLLGISLFSFFLYKHTPLGALFNTGIAKMKKGSIDEEFENFLDHSETTDAKPHNIDYNISYNSS
ncbi:Plasmodium vivax Vir protein, putative [Plasmodium ovale]|uniref:Plasmodium vivax Vir protein, putative n=1 Tax=Plasmodium ovale TaxID=36330 RepID=A0A1C3KFE8_PLAOA|nr:Plasmodium vivax Vir protein, putative [Plasmodium ovale]